MDYLLFTHVVVAAPSDLSFLFDYFFFSFSFFFLLLFGLRAGDGDARLVQLWRGILWQRSSASGDFIGGATHSSAGGAGGAVEGDVG